MTSCKPVSFSRRTLRHGVSKRQFGLCSTPHHFHELTINLKFILLLIKAVTSKLNYFKYTTPNFNTKISFLYLIILIYILEFLHSKCFDNASVIPIITFLIHIPLFCNSLWMASLMPKHVKQVNHSHNRPKVPRGFHEGSQISWQRHRMMVRLSASRTGRLYPK